MPRYEFKEGTSNKFWQIDLDGSSFTTTYGKVGTDGQSTIKEYDDEAKAKKEYDKLIGEKTKKGYKLVGGGGAAKASKKEVFEDEGDDEEEDDEDEDEAPKKKAAAKPAPAKAAPAKSGGGGKGGRRHFEFVEGSSSKFWEIELTGSSFTTKYGRIGTPGQETLKEFDSDEKAKKEYDKLVAEKTKKGYEEK